MQTNITGSLSFADNLYSRADNYFHTQPAGRFATGIFYAKGGIFIAAYLGSYLLFLFYASSFGQLVALAVLPGIFHVLIPLSMSHDAIHNAISSHRWVNQLALYGFEITGSNSYMYSKKHLEAHYNKENGNKVIAIESQGLLLQKQAADGKKNLPVFFYIFYSQYMIFLRDFILVFSDKSVPRKEFIKLFIAKLIYITVFIVIPFLVLPFAWWQILLALMVMYLIVTVFLVIILLMPTEKMEHNRLAGNNHHNDKWLVEVLEHNVDFTPGSSFLNLLAGGANMNVVHYLFPSTNHVHYNKLAAIIELTAAEFDLHYRKQQVKDVFGIHFNYLKNIQSSNS